MTCFVHHITVDCADPYGLATFWSEIVGRPVHPEDEPGDEGVLIPGTEDAPGLLFLRVPESKTVKNRVHFDLMPTDHTRDKEVERVRDLGAAVVADRRRPDGTGFVVFEDPEGNEFCVLRSAEERTDGRAPVRPDPSLGPRS